MGPWGCVRALCQVGLQQELQVFLLQGWEGERKDAAGQRVSREQWCFHDGTTVSARRGRRRGLATVCVSLQRENKCLCLCWHLCLVAEQFLKLLGDAGF